MSDGAVLDCSEWLAELGISLESRAELRGESNRNTIEDIVVINKLIKGSMFGCCRKGGRLVNENGVGDL